MLEKRDMLTGPIVAALTLLLTFLCGMAVMRSFVGVLLFSHLDPDRREPGQRRGFHEPGRQLYRRAHRSLGQAGRRCCAS